MKIFNIYPGAIEYAERVITNVAKHIKRPLLGSDLPPVAKIAKSDVFVNGTRIIIPRKTSPKDSILGSLSHEMPGHRNTTDEILTAPKKKRMDLIEKMNSGDKTQKTQEYYDELFNRIDNFGMNEQNPRTGAWVTVKPKNSPELIKVIKANDEASEVTTLYDWGDLGLVKAIKTKKEHDGMLYNSISNSELQRFDEGAGKWKDIILNKGSGPKMAMLQKSKEVRDSILGYLGYYIPD